MPPGSVGPERGGPLSSDPIGSAFFWMRMIEPTSHLANEQILLLKGEIERLNALVSSTREERDRLLSKAEEDLSRARGERFGYTVTRGEHEK